jgi:hypothetical protein
MFEAKKLKAPSQKPEIRKTIFLSSSYICRYAGSFFLSSVILLWRSQPDILRYN